MKKHIILFTILALLITAGSFIVQASENETIYCVRCNQDVSKDDWQEWDYQSGEVAGGHYKLTDDYFDQIDTVRIPEDTIVCLDLAGCTYSVSNIRMFNIAGTFTVMDSKGGGTFLSTGENGKYGGFAVVQASGSFSLYGGTVRYSAVPGALGYSGGLFYIDGGRVNIYDGTVAGGIVKATSSFNAYGGNFSVYNNGVLNIYGGTITDGKALKNGSKTAQGGNIYASSGSKINMSGGAIENGYSDAGGGNIFIADATLSITGGSILNGHALVSGGNIMANATDPNTLQISGGTISGGVCGGTFGTYANDTFARGTKGGGNIYDRSPAGILTITGGTIDGDIVLDYVKTMTLSGTPKIGLGKSGGMVFTSVGTFKANATGLTEGAEIYVQSSRVFTTAFSTSDAAKAALNYFKGAVRTQLSATSANALQGAQGTQGYCPHCSAIVTWTELTSSTTSFTGHSYLNASLIRTGNLSVSSSWVLDLNGYTLHQENRRFIFNYNQQNISLTILDSWGGGKIQGTGTGNNQGGLFYIWSNSVFELLSGTLRLSAPLKDTTPTENIVKNGGVIYAANNSTIKISGGVISNGAVTAAEGAGGNIAMVGEKGILNISAGIIASGSAAELSGGNIYASAPVTVTGGVIMGGSAKNGGNLYTTGTLNVSGGSVFSGNATNYGGNLYTTGVTEISGGNIYSGIATTAAGNIGIYGGETEILSSAIVAGGKSNSRGGNIAMGSTSALHLNGGLICAGNAASRGGNLDTATATATANINGGKIILGTSASGGNIYINNGVLNLVGGSVVGGVAKAGGNIYFNYYVYATIKDDGNSNTPLPVISHGKATNGDGGNIFFTAADTTDKYYLYLGNCVIRDGSASSNGSNIYISEKGYFKVLSEFAQNTTVYLHESRNPIKGSLLTTSSCSASGEFIGELRLENISPSPMICAENGNLRVVAAEIVLKNGTSMRFGSNEEAVKNYTENALYMIVNAGDLVLDGGNYTIDLAGQNISVSGTGNLTCFDSANKDYTSFGIASINGPKLVNTAQFVVDGINYVTVLSDGAYSFHRIDMRVESVSIRPNNAGVYYSCNWKCDSTLAEKLAHFGVAVSLGQMPGSDFMSDKSVQYTKSSQNEFKPGETTNSVVIRGILQENNLQNDKRGKTVINGTPYITILDADGNEQTVMALSDGQAQYSLYDVMQLIDQRISSDPLNYRRLTLPVRNFYETWKDDGMQTWSFNKIPAPAEDDVIDVLMIGSSFCYYYVEELYGLAEAAGVKMRVCNVYYSGCKFEWHYTWWKQGKSNYEFYQVVDNTGRKKTSALSLEHCLAQGEWDVISIQESTSTIYNAGAQNHLNTTRNMRNVLLGYLKEQFPSAKVYWHQPWAYQIGYKSGSHEVNTFEEQQERMMAIREFALGVCEENGVNRVNTGEAWQIYRKNYVGTNGLTDTLCARLGVGTNNVGDYYHDGDIGGGQYLNACVWFETLMKDLRPEDNITCIGNTYDPIYDGKYKLSQELRTALQESAHQAVIERDYETPSTEAN